MTTEFGGKKRSPTFWLAVGLIALGVLILLRSLGFLLSASVSILFSYWPLLLIGFGLDYLFKDDCSGRGEIPFGLLSVLLLAVLMVFGPLVGLGRGAGAVTEVFSEPLAGARSARVELDLNSAPTTVTALDGSADLIRATLTHQGRIAFSVRGRADKVVRLAQRGRRGFNVFSPTGQTSNHWSVALTPHIPLDLQLDGGSGRSTFDLAGLNLLQLEFDGGSGSTDFTLPAGQERYAVTLDGGSGRTVLNVTEGAEFDLSTETGSGSIDITLRRDVDARLELEGGSGSTRVVLPSDAAVRLEVEDDGSGSLVVGEQLVRMSGDDDEGVWETPGFGQAQRQITVTVEDVGSGSFQVR